jgi:hypothetical protein
VDTSETSTDSTYHLLADDAFRLEICYLLTDGTYAAEPLLYQTPASWTGGTFYTSNSGPPSTSLCAPSYAAGSRWYDTDAQRGYICLNAAANQAVWKAAGWQDVSAIIVTIAVMDLPDRTIFTAMQKDLNNVASLLGKAEDNNNAVTNNGTPLGNLRSSPPILPSQNWQYVMNTGGLNTVLPARAAGAVRVYQRYFNLNSP